MRKACASNGEDGRVGGGAVVVDVGPGQHQALRHAERKARTYGKALVGLASLLCLSVCGNLASSALSILVFKESRLFSDAIPLQAWALACLRARRFRSVCLCVSRRHGVLLVGLETLRVRGW